MHNVTVSISSNLQAQPATGKGSDKRAFQTLNPKRDFLRKIDKIRLKLSMVISKPLRMCDTTSCNEFVPLRNSEVQKTCYRLE